MLVTHQAGGHAVNDAIAAAGHETHLLLSMQVAVQAHVTLGVTLAQGGINLVRVRNLLQLVKKLLVLRGLIGPSVYDIDVLHTFKLIMVMSSLCGWLPVKPLTER